MSWLAYWVAHSAAICLLSAGSSIPEVGSTHSVIARLIKLIQDLGVYGKAQPPHRQDLWSFQIPKKLFLHFYVVGNISNILVAGAKLSSGDPIFVLCLYQLHLLRRLAECIFVHSFSATATMHVAHYILGISYYIAVPFTLASCDILPRSSWILVMATSMFLWAQSAQYQCHLILAKLRPRDENNTKTAYSVPRGGLFELVSCPHYTVEVVIYATLAACCKCSPRMLALTGFVIMELSFSASTQHSWYRRTFKDYPLNRQAIFPWIY
jgi:3-oxo-5-alpha-steroid 4-dehydrogenase 3